MFMELKPRVAQAQRVGVSIRRRPTVTTGSRGFGGSLLLVSLVCMLGLLAGCASKAKSIQVGAAEFQSQSLAAIDKIDALRQKEITPEPLSPSEASETFVKFVLGSSGSLKLADLNIMLDPLGDLPAQSEQEWQKFLQRLRSQYSEFAVIFTRLDAGSLFAVPKVDDAVPILDKLVAQLIAFAKITSDNPPVFIRDRAAITVALEDVRDDTSLSDATRREKIINLERRLRDLKAAEEAMTRETVEQTLKAAKLGQSLRLLLIDYDKLSVDDISEALAQAFQLAGTIPGLDLSGLQARVDLVLADVSNDPDMKKLVDEALKRIPKGA